MAESDSESGRDQHRILQHSNGDRKTYKPVADIFNYFNFLELFRHGCLHVSGPCRAVRDIQSGTFHRQPAKTSSIPSVV